jgi:hypothetical protein
MKSMHRSLATRIELDPKASETKRSRLAAAGSLALRSKLPILSVAVMGITGMGFMLGGAAGAVPPPTPIGLGAATNAAVEAGQSITNSGVTTITGSADASVSPGSSATFMAQCGLVNCVNYGTGTLNINNGVANTEVADAHTALVYTQGLGGASIPAQLSGATLPAGIYATGAADIAVGGVLQLDAAFNPNSVWIFNSGAITANNGSSVMFINQGAATNAQLACNVFWTSASSASIGTGANFVGTLMAQTSITVGDSATVTGRLLSGTGNATLLHDTIIQPSGCAVLPAGTGGTTSSGGGSSVATGAGTTASFAGPATPVAGLPRLTG